MVIYPGVRRYRAGVTTRLYNIVRQIFASGTNGALYAPSDINSLNQLSTGTTPVTAVTDPVGLMLDSRLGLALGAELVTNGGFDSDTSWTKAGGVTISSGVCSFAAVNNSNGVYQLAIPAASLKSFLVTLDVTVTSGTYECHIGGLAINPYISQSGKVQFVLTSTASGNGNIIFGCSTFTGTFDNISVRLLEGNHALQATAAARPTWNADASGFKYLSFLGTDDCLTSATGGGGSAGFFWCGVIQPTGGAGTAREIWSDEGVNVGYIVRLTAANKLSFVAGNGAGYTILNSTAAVDVGTKYLLTVWDDGTNLNVQIDSAAAETTARPVVVGGSVGISIGKNNRAASNFLIGNLYPSIYWKDTAKTAADRAIAQAYVKAMAGL